MIIFQLIGENNVANRVLKKIISDIRRLEYYPMSGVDLGKIVAASTEDETDVLKDILICMFFFYWHIYQKYQRIAARRGGKRALIAIAHSMLIAIYHILKELKPFKDLGSNYFVSINEEKIIKKNIKSIENLGYEVVLQKV